MRDLKLTFGAHQADLTGYADADGSMHEDRKAISGYAYLINGAATWSSKQQEIIALSTTEAEYVAATHATAEGHGKYLYHGNQVTQRCPCGTELHANEPLTM